MSHLILSSYWNEETKEELASYLTAFLLKEGWDEERIQGLIGSIAENKKDRDFYRIARAIQDTA